MIDVITWLEQHDKLAGWAQFIGAILALFVTYFTAFTPLWRRKRQLNSSARRLLSNGFETIESYHRTSAQFDPFPLSIRQACLTMTSVVDEISRFPVYELSNQNTQSIARRLVTMSLTLSALSLTLNHLASEIEARGFERQDKENLRFILQNQLEVARKLVLNEALNHPPLPT